ncbi:hypothetical protein EYB53_010750 [Candidatus Chloroploca sp. M-50]|uniref:FtsK domain-containing protein n=1 Tax=Candidatus Chloroploca mongolica TaxID=2528176 RepID=A0ABS4D9R7_9CHLR|nr:FtsK/SpoIIIE domain-containing protein [Candidatus Chloroploca mongolica]MBP1466184.1 hypothetical protein [Candidatus Chloroploca mongolica]
MEAWFRDPGNMVLALGVALCLLGLARFGRLVAWGQRMQALHGHALTSMRVWPRALARAGTSATSARPAAPPRADLAAPPALLAGAGRALRDPPGIEATLSYLRRHSPNDRYRLPLGWCRSDRQEAGLVHTALVGETNHILISGASDSGKDNLAWWMLLALALVHHEPHELHVAIIDGKGLDFQPWASKAQTWALATDPETIPDVLRALTAERQRRKAVLTAAGVSKWDHYHGHDLPLLVVFISELSLLETALKRERTQRERDRTLDLELDLWLNTELTAGRAFGMRYLIGMQTVTGMDMLWRSQIGVFMGSYQPDETQVKPNLAKTAKQIAAAGAVPPHHLPPPPTGAGVFTIVSGEQCITTRAPYLSDAERRRWLGLLPDRLPTPDPGCPEPPANAQLYPRHRTPYARSSEYCTTATGTSPGAAASSGVLPNTAFDGAANGAAHPSDETTGEFNAPTNPMTAASSAGDPLALLPFTISDIARLSARIARGDTKTEIVRSMPGYATRRHREFVGYYDAIAAILGEEG